jgi:hypothetical protein
MSNHPARDMKSHEESGIVDLLGSSCHIRHDKGGCDGKNRLPLFETNASTAYFLLDRGLCKTIKGITPWKGIGKQLRKVLIQVIELVFGVSAIAEKAIILGRVMIESCVWR